MGCGQYQAPINQTGVSLMKKILLASVAAGALALAGGVTGALTTADSANAADLRMPLKAPPPPAPVFSWSGCYVGANWGWGWGNSRADPFYQTVDGHVGVPGIERNFGGFDHNNISGPVFGGQVGCNYQWPSTNFVVGFQGDYDAAAIDNFIGTNHPFTPTFTLPVAQNYAKVDGIASFTGRIGWNGWNPSTLFYFKGGWAWAHERVNLGSAAFDFDAVPFGPFTGSRNGWTVGGGFEWALSFAQSASVFIEYDYYSFGNKDLCVFNCGFGLKEEGVDELFVHRHLNLNVVKIGVNYKPNWFGGGGPY
jgi:outer membrane immunogenic protein